MSETNKYNPRDRRETESSEEWIISNPLLQYRGLLVRYKSLLLYFQPENINIQSRMQFKIDPNRIISKYLACPS